MTTNLTRTKMPAAALERADEFWQEFRGLSISRKPTRETSTVETIREDKNTASLGNKVVLISYNVNRCYQKDRVRDTLAEVLERHNPDVLLLQEAPIYETGPFWHDPLFQDYNAYFVPFHHVTERTDHYNFCRSGQLTLAKPSFSQTFCHELSTVTDVNLGRNHKTGRVLSYTQHQTLTKTVGIYNIHLENGCFPFGRKIQIDEILNIIEDRNDDVVVLGGDFNTWAGKRFELGLKKLVEAEFHDLFRPFRWGVHGRLDYFFVRGAEEYRAEELLMLGSDHHPITAAVYIK